MEDSLPTVFSADKYPTSPFTLFATESKPNATEPQLCELAPEPNAVELLPSAIAPFPIAVV